jgi:hypothetical protein
MSDLPTKPGPYYWRESDGSEWEICIVETNDDGELCALLDDEVFWVPVKEKANLQWLPIPTAEELVELQSAKKMVDESREQWQIWNPCHSKLEMVGRTEDEAITAFRKSIPSSNPPEPWSQFLAAGYTCRKVRVCMEVES